MFRLLLVLTVWQQCCWCGVQSLSDQLDSSETTLERLTARLKALTERLDTALDDRETSERTAAGLNQRPTGRV